VRGGFGTTTLVARTDRNNDHRLRPGVSVLVVSATEPHFRNCSKVCGTLRRIDLEVVVPDGQGLFRSLTGEIEIGETDCARDRPLRLREIRLNLRIREHLIVSDTLYGRVALFCVQVSRERAKLPHRARKIRGVDSGIAVRPLHVAPFARLLLFYQGSGHRIVITCNAGTKRFSLGLLPANLSGHDRVPVLVIDKRGPDILHRLPPKPTQLVVIVDSPAVRGAFENPFDSCYRDDHSNPPEKMRGLQPTQTLGRGCIQERADLRLGERSPVADIQRDEVLWSGCNGPWKRFKKPLYRLGVLLQYA